MNYNEIEKETKEYLKENFQNFDLYIKEKIVGKDIIGGELINDKGEIFSFSKVNDKIILKDSDSFIGLNLNDDITLKTIPLSQKYVDKKTTDMVIFYDDEKTKERKYLCINRMFPPSGLALVGGQIEKGENPLSNALKETGEEVGLSISEKDITHIGTYKGEEIRGTVKSELYVVNLNKIFGEKLGDVLKLLVPASDAIGMVFKKLEDVVEKKDEKRTINSMVPHHQEILKTVDSILKMIDTNEKKLNTPVLNSKITLDEKGLIELGLNTKIVEKIEKMNDFKLPEIEKKKKDTV